MTQSSPHSQLNRQSLGYFKPLFVSLPAPEWTDLPGFYQAEFTGPAWLRAIAPPGLAIGGLGGWWGKELHADGSGMNIVARGGSLRRVLPVRFELGPSSLDGQPAILIRYPPDSRFPWPRVVDELRRLEAGCLLGLTFFNIGRLNELPMPFLLFHREKPNGL